MLGLTSGCAVDRDRDRNQTKLIVSAAASMQDVLKEIATLYHQKHPQAKIIFNFGSSGSL